jgi:hypothetical protein
VRELLWSAIVDTDFCWELEWDATDGMGWVKMPMDITLSTCKSELISGRRARYFSVSPAETAPARPC